MSKNSFAEQAPDFSAHIQLLSTEDGGRDRPALLGYRPIVWFELLIPGISSTSGSWQKMDRLEIFPGETSEIEIALLAKDFYKNQLFPGLKFRLTEGAKLIGTGEILEILNPELKA